MDDQERPVAGLDVRALAAHHVGGARLCHTPPMAAVGQPMPNNSNSAMLQLLLAGPTYRQ